MNLYRLFKLYGKIKSRRIRLLGVYGLHCTGKRYLGVFLDPVLACNFRCKMCYFSDQETRKIMRGTLHAEELRLIARALFHRALKLQIGCAAEPTLSHDLVELVRLGTHYKVPYISLTTNGSLLTGDALTELVSSGLHEITLSTHGVTKETYEYLMENGSFENFRRLLGDLAAVKAAYPSFKIRINYTVNADNFQELARFWDTFEGVPVDVLQLRPVQKIGDTKYTNFRLTEIYTCFDRIVSPLVHACKEKGTTCLYPKKENLLALEQETERLENEIENFTYCAVSPRCCWEDDFDFRSDSFESYSKRAGLGKKMLKAIFRRQKKASSQVIYTRKMNYTVN